MMWRGYNERAEPEIDKIIKKAVGYAKKVILSYYSEKGMDYSQEVRVFIDNESANETNKINHTFTFYNDKDNIGKELDEEDFNFINDRILSAVKVYGIHLGKDKQNLVSEELEQELRQIDEIIIKNSVKGGNYDLYTILYVELSSLGL